MNFVPYGYTVYKHDNLVRLVKTEIANNLTYETSEITYAFDKTGNRTAMTEDSVTTDYTDYGETTKKVNAEFYNEICYTGGIYDELTGLYHLQN